MNNISIDQHHDLLAFSIIYYIDGIVSIFACLAHLLIFLACLRPNLRKMASFNLIAFMSISCTLELISISFFNLVHQIAGRDPSEPNEFWCRFQAFFNIFSLQWISWLMVAHSFEILLTIRYPAFRKKFSLIKVTIAFSISTGFILAFLNIPALFIIQVTDESSDSFSNQTSQFICLVTKYNTDLPNSIIYVTIVSFI